MTSEWEIHRNELPLRRIHYYTLVFIIKISHLHEKQLRSCQCSIQFLSKELSVVGCCSAVFLVAYTEYCNIAFGLRKARYWRSSWCVFLSPATWSITENVRAQVWSRFEFLLYLYFLDFHNINNCLHLFYTI